MYGKEASQTFLVRPYSGLRPRLPILDVLPRLLALLDPPRDLVHLFVQKIGGGVGACKYGTAGGATAGGHSLTTAGGHSLTSCDSVEAVDPVQP